MSKANLLVGKHFTSSLEEGTLFIYLLTLLHVTGFQFSSFVFFKQSRGDCRMFMEIYSTVFMFTKLKAEM